jgi:riboflavin synthase
MFTGLIETTGRVERIEGSAAAKRLVVSAPFAAELAPGDSVAVNGVCLTVAMVDDETFGADLSRATLDVTSFGSMRAGRLVNLERSLRADARLGGHFVLGHVDGTSRVIDLRPDGDGCWLGVALPPPLAAYVIPKGSIAIDGISLTVASLDGRSVGMQIVPYTLAHTALREARPGDVVNVETDVLGKYVARLLAGGDRRAMSVADLERQST